MVPAPKPLRIVRYYTPLNAGTGDNHYVTEDGTHWRDAYPGEVEASKQWTMETNWRKRDRGYVW